MGWPTMRLGEPVAAPMNLPTRRDASTCRCRTWRAHHATPSRRRPVPRPARHCRQIGLEASSRIGIDVDRRMRLYQHVHAAPWKRHTDEVRTRRSDAIVVALDATEQSSRRRAHCVHHRANPTHAYTGPRRSPGYEIERRVDRRGDLIPSGVAGHTVTGPGEPAGNTVVAAFWLAAADSTRIDPEGPVAGDAARRGHVEQREDHALRIRPSEWGIARRDRIGHRDRQRRGRDRRRSQQSQRADDHSPATSR